MKWVHFSNCSNTAIQSHSEFLFSCVVQIKKKKSRMFWSFVVELWWGGHNQSPVETSSVSAPPQNDIKKNAATWKSIFFLPTPPPPNFIFVLSSAYLSESRIIDLSFNVKGDVGAMKAVPKFSQLWCYVLRGSSFCDSCANVRWLSITFRLLEKEKKNKQIKDL